MPRAALQIDLDTSSVQRMFGVLRQTSRTAAAAITADMRAVERDQQRSARRMEAEARRTAAAAARAARDAEKAKTRAAAEEARNRDRIATREAREFQKSVNGRARDFERAERRVTTLAEQYTRQRERSAKREADTKIREARRAAREAEREMARGQRELGARQTRAGGFVMRAASAVGSAALGYAGTMHGEIQGARRQRAVANRELGAAVRNAGGSQADADAARAGVARFAQQTGMEYGDVVGALRLGQDRGSVLEPDTARGQTRQQALDEALRTVREANAEGADPGMLLAARGRLGQAGLTGDTLNTAMRFAMRASQRGAVEIDQIIQQGLPGASSLMSQRAAALGPNATDAQRQAERLKAFQESVALQEVAATTGRLPGNTANTLGSLNNFLATPRRQEMILQNIRSAESQVNTRTPEGRARAAQLRALYEGPNAVFEHDDTRTGDAMRLKAGMDPLALSARLAAATGGNANQAANILAGGGHGNPQSLLANMRSMMSFLGSDGSRVISAMNGGGVTQGEIDQHQREVENDQLAQLNRAEESRASALTDNTSAIVNLSNRFADWSTAHPFESQGAQAAPGLLAPLGEGAASLAFPDIVRRVGALFVDGGAASTALGAGGTAGAAPAAATVAGGGAAAGTPLALGAAAAVGVGAGAYTAVTGRDAVSGQNLPTGQRIQNAIDPTSMILGGLLEPLGRAIANALSGTTIHATVSPVDATQAAASAATARGR